MSKDLERWERFREGVRVRFAHCFDDQGERMVIDIGDWPALEAAFRGALSAAREEGRAEACPRREGHEVYTNGVKTWCRQCGREGV